MTKEEIQQLLSQNSLRVIAVTDGLTDVYANMRPENGGWSIAEIIEHLSLTDKVVYLSLRRAKKISSGTINPDSLIKEYLLENQNPVNAPLVVVPASNIQLAGAIYNFNYWRDAIFAYIKQQTESFDDTYSVHPLLGQLSRRQWLLFSLYHTERHLLQILRTKSYLVQHN